MSIKSWIEEFYPPINVNDPDIDLIQHSLNKWKGALLENCKKHNVEYMNHSIVNAIEASFGFDGDTCALCEAFYGRDSTCKNCPIFIAHQFECDTGDDGTYQQSLNDPQPMIDLLQSTLDFYTKKD